MPTQTPITDQAAPLVPSGEDIYDALMADIEMDLITVNLPLLDEKYAGETPGQKAERMARYEAAYKAYDEAFKQWLEKLRAYVAEARRKGLKTAETKDRQQEEAELNKLMQSFSS